MVKVSLVVILVFVLQLVFGKILRIIVVSFLFLSFLFIVPTKCPASVISLPSGNYTVPVSDVGRSTQDCASGYEGTVSLDCSASFTWSGNDEGCRMLIS